jgi:hypothetical protein
MKTLIPRQVEESRRETEKPAPQGPSIPLRFARDDK